MDIYISTSDVECSEAKALKKLFTKYQVNVVYERSRSCLLNLQSIVARCKGDNCCLFLKDDSLSIFNSADIESVLEDILCYKWDIFYLCKWLDYCEEYTKYTKLNSKFVAVKSHNPQGIQALIISPRIFNTIISIKSEAELLTLIKNEKIKAMAVVPYIFEFDIGKRESDADIIKRFPCQSVFASTPNIRSYVQNGGNPSTQLELAKGELEKTTFKPTTPVPRQETAMKTKSGNWLDVESYEDLTKAFLLVMILGVIVTFFKKPNTG